MASKKPYSELSRSGKCRRLSKLKIATNKTTEDGTISDSSFQDGCNDVHINIAQLPSDENNNNASQNDSDYNRTIENQHPESWDKELSSESEIGSEDGGTIFECNLKDQKLYEDIKKWAIQFHITNIALSALLVVLRSNNVTEKSMPIDARTLLNTPLAVETRIVAPGMYCHIGFRRKLENLWHKVTESVSSIDLLVGIDGLPLFRSSSGELWPILVSVINIPSIAADVFPVGIYYGKKKPSSNKTFLEEFISEINLLLEGGIILNGKKMLVTLKGFCCDAPAKAFILGIKGHTGYSSCTKCKQEGQYTEHRVVFPDIPDRETLRFLMRTQEGFLRQEDPSHHNMESPLVSIPNLNFITAFPLDYMHLVCLGVMRSLLYIWMFAIPHKLPQRLVDIISTRLINLRPFIPTEFCRKPRCLDDIKRWKATEFRQFLLYTGPVVLKDVLSPELYLNFLELHVAIRILTNPKHCEIHKLYAQDLLIHFLKSFKSLYGKRYMTHNFHGLLHLADNVTTFGPLDNCSAFRFENYLYSMKKLLRKGDKPLQQLVKRLSERSQSCTTSVQQNYPFCSSPDLSSSNHFKKINFKDFVLSNLSPNYCCRLTDGSVIIIENIKQLEGSVPVITCKKFNMYNDYFGNALCNSSSLGIYKVSNLLQVNQDVLASEVAEKLVLLPLVGRTEELLVLPLLHSE